MVLLPTAAALLTLPAYQCLIRVESADQAQSRQAARAAQLAWWLRHGRSQLGRCAGSPRFVAQLGRGPAIEREVGRRNWMQRQVPVGRMSAVRLVSARVTLLRVAAVPVEEATWAIPARMSAKLMKAAEAILTRTRAATALALPGVSPSRVERPARAKEPPSGRRAGP
jgi:hypothetical protein